MKQDMRPMKCRSIADELPMMTHDNHPRVILARQQDFRLGALEVSPATREVSAGPFRDILEPRVMQVLVALARAEGTVVTRDDLTMSCWDGRVVGDDAINRVLGRLRKLAIDGSHAWFTVTTVRKVGYRLDAVRDRPAAEARETPSEAPPLSLGRRWINSLFGRLAPDLVRTAA
jgi:DNA-binding winged helix-turn-helix (wHTH) protein